MGGSRWVMPEALVSTERDAIDGRRHPHHESVLAALSAPGRDFEERHPYRSIARRRPRPYAPRPDSRQRGQPPGSSSN